MRFRVLGSVQASVDGRSLPLGGRRQVSLLACLLVYANRPVSSDALIDAVWGSERSGADKRLQMAIARLRKALEPQNGADGPALQTVGGGYLLSVEPGELDSEVFAAGVVEGRRALEAGEAERAAGLLAEALGLWRGQALSEVAFEDFAQAEIRRLEELRWAALEARVDSELLLGRHLELVGELEGLLAQQPGRERVAGQLMLALYRCGRQTDALEVYRRHRAHLAEELGLEPAPALRALQVQILEQAPSLEVSSPETSVTVPPVYSGTVTFLSADVEGSERLLGELGGERFGEELVAYRERVREAVAAHGGQVLGSEADRFFVVFAGASDALDAAGAVQAGLVGGELRARIGVHTGEPLLIDGDYVGLDVHKAWRVCAAAHAGQVLVSQATRDLAEARLRDLGEHRLKDLTAPERLFQLGEDQFGPLRGLRATNLPVQPGPLLGRHKEVLELLALVREHRLLTLTGPGGSGKTRLALELAAQLSDDHRDGAWWVSLAAVTEPALVAPTIMESLGAQGELREHLAGKRALLLLDNLEQVLEAAPLIADLLGSLPELSVIATSRERLAVSFEQEYPVPPLDEAAAEELFVSRARQLKPDFGADEAVGEICRRLDRLPLALELASTRVKLMSSSQMLRRLERRLDLLGRGMRDRPDRQATMRATIGWSYDLLPDAERALFRRLGVFAGSFDLEAAEAVCDAELDDLQSLIDKSLLRQQQDDRFFLLELTREYALEQLHIAGETEQVRRRHADWFLKLVREADKHIRSADQRRWFSRLDADTDNLRAILAWCSERDPASVIELAPMLYVPWAIHGRSRELVSWLKGVLAKPATIDARSRAIGLRTLGEALAVIGQPDKARGPVQESLALFRELNDKSGEATALRALGHLLSDQGSQPQAINLLRASIAISRAAGDKWNVARALWFLGGSVFFTRDLERSRIDWEESATIFTELGDHWGTARPLRGLADVALASGDPAQAERQYHEVLELISGNGDEHAEMRCVAGLACVAALRGNLHSAGRLWGTAEAAEKRLGSPVLEFERALYEQIVTPLQDDPSFEAGYHAGRDVDLAQAVHALRTASYAPNAGQPPRRRKPGAVRSRPTPSE
jgi:predicted ATPase/DNA-binding SARP family transcriptional activator